MAYNLQLIDTHCHLSFRAFNDTWQDALKRAALKNIAIICVGAAKETSEKSITVANYSKNAFASVGLHPTHAEDEVFDYDWYSASCDNKKVVAVGETGIDHFHLDESRGNEILQKQEELLLQHLTLAKEKNLPVILHSRDGKEEQGGKSYRHLYKLVKDFGYYNCVVHCFGGSWEDATKFLDLGLMISFTGIITFKNASDSLKSVVKQMPLDRLMIETDSPYLAPQEHRGKQNEPAFVEYVAQGIANIKGMDYDKVAQVTVSNAVKFFGIKV